MWSLTLFPSTQAQKSKTQLQDNTLVIGGTNERRAWLSGVAAALKRNAAGRTSLFGLSQPKMGALHRRAFTLAGLPKSTPHRLRHGGASADAMAGVSPTIIQARGFWRAANSVERYRKPGQYLRQLALLSPAQLRAATVAARRLERDLPQLLVPARATKKPRNR